MKNKKIIPLICLMVGIALIIGCLIGKGLEIFDTYKALFGVMLGIGSGLLGGGFGELINIYLLDKNSVLRKKKEIEMNDERNMYINDKAKAKAFGMMEYTLPLVIFIGVLLDIDFAVTMIMLIAYISIFISYIYYFNKYSKEM